MGEKRWTEGETSGARFLLRPTGRVSVGTLFVESWINGTGD